MAIADRDRAPERARMVEQHLRRRGIRDQRVLAAFAAVPREAFLDPADAAAVAAAYDDRPLPIGAGQTMSQPYVVAVMVEALALRATDRVLEIGAGSGYAAAVLGRLAGEVDAIERQPSLAGDAAARLRRLGYANVTVHTADGARGLPERAPFDAILVSAGATEVPVAVLDELAPGGRLVMPVGGPGEQRLLRLTRVDDGLPRVEDLGWVSFVPLLADLGED